MVSHRNAEVGDEVRSTTFGDRDRSSSLGTGLVIDVDRQFARAVLFDTVGGHGRFITSCERPSTLMPPIADGTAAVRDAIRQVEQDTGSVILGDHGVESPRDGHTGVDFLTVTGQPAEPVRVAFIPIGSSRLTLQLVAAARRTPTLVETFDGVVRTEDGVLSGTLLESSIRGFAPDAVVIVDGENTQAEWATAVGTLSSLSAEGVIEQVIIVARDQYQQQAAQTMGEDADLRGIDPAEFEAADIASAIELELNTLNDARFVPGAVLSGAQSVPFTGRARAGDLVTRFLARRREQSVTAVSIGDGTIIHSATPDVGLIGVRPDIDVHARIRSVLREDPKNVHEWLPISMSDEEISHWILNRALRPTTVSDTDRDRLIEAAIATAVLRSVWRDLAPADYNQHDLIIGGSLFARWDTPALALLCLLNALEPRPESGLVDVTLDVDGMFHAAGAVGELSPALAADVVERDLLSPLASVIVVESTGNEGDLAVRGEIQYASGSSSQFSVPVGSIHQLDLGAGDSAVLTLNCEPESRIGANEAGASVTYGDQARLQGGQLGIVIDARGRPVTRGTDSANQPARISGWLSDLGSKELA